MKLYSVSGIKRNTFYSLETFRFIPDTLYAIVRSGVVKMTKLSPANHLWFTNYNNSNYIQVENNQEVSDLFKRETNSF